MDLKTRLVLILNYDPSKIDRIATKDNERIPEYRIEVRKCENCCTRLSGYNLSEKCYHHKLKEAEIYELGLREEAAACKEVDDKELIENIVHSACSYYNLSFESVVGFDPLVQPIRMLLAFLLHVDAKLSQNKIGKILHRNGETMGRWVRKIDLTLVYNDMIAIRSMYQNKNIYEELRI